MNTVEISAWADIFRVVADLFYIIEVSLGPSLQRPSEYFELLDAGESLLFTRHICSHF